MKRILAGFLFLFVFVCPPFLMAQEFVRFNPPVNGKADLWRNKTWGSVGAFPGAQWAVRIPIGQYPLFTFSPGSIGAGGHTFILTLNCIDDNSVVRPALAIPHLAQIPYYMMSIGAGVMPFAVYAQNQTVTVPIFGTGFITMIAPQVSCPQYSLQVSGLAGNLTDTFDLLLIVGPQPFLSGTNSLSVVGEGFAVAPVLNQQIALVPAASLGPGIWSVQVNCMYDAGVLGNPEVSGMGLKDTLFATQLIRCKPAMSVTSSAPTSVTIVLSSITGGLEVVSLSNGTAGVEYYAQIVVTRVK